MPIEATKTFPVHIEDHVDRQGWYGPAVLALVFNRSRRQIDYAAGRGLFGAHRIRDGRKVYSLAAASYCYGQLPTDNQIKEAVKNARNANFLALYLNLIELRDLEWREAIKKAAPKGIKGFIEPEPRTMSPMREAKLVKQEKTKEANSNATS